MIKGKRSVEDYIQARREVLEYFQCEGDFFIKPLMDANWAIQNNGDYQILSYWLDDGKRTDAIIVKKGGVPLIYKTWEHVMVVGIDCVKIGFVFRKKNKQELA